ncbi:hypothetical protein PI124_g24398 [Phytophthora idaei]|nr:hypothetical protein PI125_g26861 [Phytophthora idaei]KAG3143325.1 hypothetical protein PI126_g14683 [Phytophthora idaei]KAG3230504.1 hypothetical protein PI124_g24398 [Phytophthora idaei]
MALHTDTKYGGIASVEEVIARHEDTEQDISASVGDVMTRY